MSDVSEGARGLHHLVVQRLGQLIASGELEENAQLMPEALGERFGASRPVVREALRALEAKGMVRPRPKTGTRVLPMSDWNMLDQDVIAWRATGSHAAVQLAELSDLRAAVEVVSARRCAERATEEQIAALNAACDDMTKAARAGDRVRFTRADIAFHTGVLEGSGNAIFGTFAVPFAAFLHTREDTLPEHLDEAAIDDHRRIVKAIESGDPAAAESLARTLVERGRQEFEASMASAHHPAHSA